MHQSIARKDYSVSNTRQQYIEIIKSELSAKPKHALINKCKILIFFSFLFLQVSQSTPQDKIDA